MRVPVTLLRPRPHLPLHGFAVLAVGLCLAALPLPALPRPLPVTLSLVIGAGLLGVVLAEASARPSREWPRALAAAFAVAGLLLPGGGVAHLLLAAALWRIAPKPRRAANDNRPLPAATVALLTRRAALG